MTLILPHRRALLTSSFDPRSISSLQLWLAADRIVANNGDPVQTWADLSGLGNDATQATASKRPLYKVGKQNGKPGIQFDGVDDYLATAAFAASIFQPTTIFVVASIPLFGGTPTLFDGINAAHRQVTWFQNNNTINYFAGATVSTPLTASTAVFVWENVFNGAASSLSQNGSGLLAGNSGTQDLTGLTLGNNQAQSLPLIGFICEFLLYGRLLSASERQVVRQIYLGSKYSLAVS